MLFVSSCWYVKSKIMNTCPAFSMKRWYIVGFQPLVRSDELNVNGVHNQTIGRNLCTWTESVVTMHRTKGTNMKMCVHSRQYGLPKTGQG